MKRLILILLISFALTEVPKSERKISNKPIERRPPRQSQPPLSRGRGGCLPPPRCRGPGCRRPKKCGPGEKLIDGECYIEKPTCKPGERYSNGRCEKSRRPRPICGTPFIRNRCRGGGCRKTPVSGEIRNNGKSPNKIDNVPKKE